MSNKNKYPTIDDNNFYKKITEKFNKYHIKHVLKDNEKSMQSICFPDKFILQPSQKFVSEFMSPNTHYNGILLNHYIGSGKTCSAISICEKWKHKKKIYVVLPAFLKGNFRDELRSSCGNNNYLTDDEREELKKYNLSSEKYKNIIKKSDDRIDTVYHIYSYNKFIQSLLNKEIKLDNCILVIDEVQNIVSESGSYYKIIYDAIYKAPNNIKIVLLSATPIFDKPVEFALTFNLLRPKKQLPVGKEFYKKFIKIKKDNKGNIKMKTKNMKKFKQYIKGYISYYRGAPPFTFPESKIKYVKCEMEKFQYKSYVTVLSSEESSSVEMLKAYKKNIFENSEILDLPNNFFIGSRIISNVAYPNTSHNVKGYESLTPNISKDLDMLKNYSIKFYKIMKKIKSTSGNTFIYSAFKEYGGIKTLVKILEAHGYKNYLIHGAGKKRFAVWSGDESPEKKENIKKIFNDTNNKDGSKIRIILGSPSIKEGVSLLNVKIVHLIEPYWNNSRIEQVVGRAIRFCAHKNLPREERNVKVYIYIACSQYIKQTVDEYIYELAKKKIVLNNLFNKAIKEAAIDCELFKNANVYPGEEDIKCEK